MSDTIPDPHSDSLVSEAGGIAVPPFPLRMYQVYILILLAIPLVFLVSSIPIVRSASFPIESADPFLLNLDYAFNLKHVDCDVVIFGDSTALTGIDPTVVERTTGLKTCNIAQAQSMLKILGFVALDTYLKNNTAPKYVVMQFAPETLAWDSKNFFWPEGLTLLLRRKAVLEVLPLFASHPVESYNFALWAIKAKLKALLYPLPDFSSTERIFHTRDGLLILPKPPQTRCVKNSPYMAPKLSWVRMLREKYSEDGTRVLINVSPVPTCAPDAAQIASDTSNVTDNSLQLFPIGFFCDLDRHLTLEGAERSSLDIGRQILSLKGP
jgi:hypothetical protein